MNEQDKNAFDAHEFTDGIYGKAGQKIPRFVSQLVDCAS